MTVDEAIREVEETHNLTVTDFSANDAPFLIPITGLKNYFQSDVVVLEKGLEYYIKKLRCKISFLPF